MSPQQANGDATDHRTDLFSLGSVLYFMSTGHPPFRAERAMGVLHRICQDRQRPVGELNCDIPLELSDCIDRLLEKKPQHRFATASDVEQTLCRLLAKWQQGGIRRRKRFVHNWIGYIAVAALVVAFGTIAVLQIPTGTSHHSDTPESKLGVDGSNANAPQAAGNFAEESESIERNLRVLESLSSESSFAKPIGSFQQSVESIERALRALDGTPSN